MIKIALKNIIKKFSLTLTTLISLSLTLFAIAFMSAAYLNVNHLSKQIDQSFKVVVSIDPSLEKSKNKDEYIKIEQQIKSIANVKDFKFSSKSQELTTLLNNDLGKELTSNLQGENPLSDTYYVSVNTDKDLGLVSSQIKKIAGVSDATFGGDVVKSVINGLHKGENLMIVTIIISILIAGLLIMNILRVAILNSKEGIEIMRLVGASNSYIRGPYIIEAIILTIISAIISTTILYFALTSIYSMSTKLNSLNIYLDVFNNVFLISSVVSIATGLVISILSSIITIRRFIKI